MLGGALQDDCSHRSELRRIKLGGASRFGHCPQSINAAVFKQPFPCVYGLPCNAHTATSAQPLPECSIRAARNPTRTCSSLPSYAKSVGNAFCSFMADAVSFLYRF